jgi:hypothetical protein
MIVRPAVLRPAGIGSPINSLADAFGTTVTRKSDHRVRKTLNKTIGR